VRRTILSRPDTPSATTITAANALFPTRYPFTSLKIWDDTNGMTAAELQNVLATLRSGRPVATGIWWLTNFATVDVRGVPLLKDYPRSANTHPNTALNPMVDGHSIDLVGFRVSHAFPGGRYFIFRNGSGPASVMRDTDLHRSSISARTRTMPSRSRRGRGSRRRELLAPGTKSGRPVRTASPWRAVWEDEIAVARRAGGDGRNSLVCYGPKRTALSPPVSGRVWSTQVR
jgi:hypothetical protein